MQTSGSFFGLRLERGAQEFVIKWHGRFNDLQDEDIKALYRQVQHLAGQSDRAHAQFQVAQMTAFWDETGLACPRALVRTPGVSPAVTTPRR